MKYGIIYPNYGDKAKQYSGYNVGDAYQCYALEYLYDIMGIDKSDRQYVSLSEINEYSGDYVLLPMLGTAVGIQFAKIPLPKRIIPVFISSHIAKADLCEEEIAFLKQYQPIGCRDEFTLNNMRKHNIDSYLSGCITAILPRIETLKKDEKRKKVYLVDIPSSLTHYIPSEIMENAETITHLLPLENETMEKADAIRFYEQAKDILNQYRDKASLVISSRMHAIVPCLAMGIPVIAAFENISYRFAWLEKYLKLYSPTEFDKINWHPEPIYYEETKQMIIDVFSAQITDSYIRYNDCLRLSQFYENRSKAQYGNHFIEILQKIHSKKNDGFTYMIWGCGLIGSIVYDIMQKEFPKSRLVVAIDSFVEGQWNSVPIIKPCDIEKYNDSFIILASYSGASDGFKKMKELGKQEYKDFVYVATKNG